MLRALWRPLRALARWLLWLLARFDGRDVLLLAALSCLTAGVWSYSPGAALIVLGGLLLAGWALPVVGALLLRRGSGREG